MKDTVKLVWRVPPTMLTSSDSPRPRKLLVE